MADGNQRYGVEISPNAPTASRRYLCKLAALTSISTARPTGVSAPPLAEATVVEEEAVPEPARTQATLQSTASAASSMALLRSISYYYYQHRTSTTQHPASIIYMNPLRGVGEQRGGGPGRIAARPRRATPAAGNASRTPCCYAPRGTSAANIYARTTTLQTRCEADTRRTVPPTRTQPAHEHAPHEHTPISTRANMRHCWAGGCRRGLTTSKRPHAITKCLVSLPSASTCRSSNPPPPVIVDTSFMHMVEDARSGRELRRPCLR
jgi:hypothetical protein